MVHEAGDGEVGVVQSGNRGELHYVAGYDLGPPEQRVEQLPCGPPESPARFGSSGRGNHGGIEVVDVDRQVDRPSIEAYRLRVSEALAETGLRSFAPTPSTTP